MTSGEGRLDNDRYLMENHRRNQILMREMPGAAFTNRMLWDMPTRGD